MLTRAQADEAATELYDHLVHNTPARRQLADYYAGVFPLPYLVSDNARQEYRALLRKARVNFIRVCVDAVAERLHVDKVNTNLGDNNDRLMRNWLADNDYDSRQGITHTDALIFGETAVSVWPGDEDGEPPRVRPESPMQVWLEPDPYDADQTILALKRIVAPHYREARIWLYEDEAVHVWTIELGAEVANDQPLTIEQFAPQRAAYERLVNPMGALPFVPFRNAPDSRGGFLSEVADIRASQDRINQTLFSRIMVAEYASFRQRWATGLNVPRDPRTNQPIEPFEAAVNRLWISENPDTKWGEFAQSSMADHIRAIEQDLELMSAQSRVPVTYLISKLANVSGEALESLEAGLVAKVVNRQRMFARSWREVMSLVALAAGNRQVAEAPRIEIDWTEPERRTLSQMADGFGKLHQQLQVPLEACWAWLGASADEIARWNEMLAAEQTAQAEAQAIAIGQTMGYQPPAVTGAA